MEVSGAPKLEALLPNNLYRLTIGNLVSTSKRLEIYNRMGIPKNCAQEEAFWIRAHCIYAEQKFDQEMGIRILGVHIGRIEREIEYNSSERLKSSLQEILGELEGDIEEATSGSYAKAFQEERFNVLYGHWNRIDAYNIFCRQIQKWAPEQILPAYTSWFGPFLAKDAEPMN